MAEDPRQHKIVNMKFPAGCAHAYQKTDPVTGEVWDKVILSFPKGMRVDGRDLGDGWYLVAFQTNRMRQQIEAGGAVTLSVRAFKADKDTGDLVPNHVKAFLGSGRDAIALDLSPWSVAIGLRDVRAQLEINNRPDDYPYEGNAEGGTSYGQAGGDPLSGRSGGRSTPSRKKKKLVDDDSFASRTKRMRALSAELAQ